MCSPRIVTIEPPAQARAERREGGRAGHAGLRRGGSERREHLVQRRSAGRRLGVTGSSGGSGQVMIVSITLMSSSVLPSVDAHRRRVGLAVHDAVHGRAPGRARAARSARCRPGPAFRAWRPRRRRAALAPQLGRGVAARVGDPDRGRGERDLAEVLDVEVVVQRGTGRRGHRPDLVDRDRRFPHRRARVHVAERADRPDPRPAAATARSCAGSPACGAAATACTRSSRSTRSHRSAGRRPPRTSSSPGSPARSAPRRHRRRGRTPSSLTSRSKRPGSSPARAPCSRVSCAGNQLPKSLPCA